MGEDARAGGPAVSAADNPEQLREEIEKTREELGDTVAALADKTDVKAQARERFEHAKSSVVGRKDELVQKARGSSPDSALSAASGASQKARQNPLPLAAAGAFAAGFIAGRIINR